MRRKERSKISKHFKDERDKCFAKGGIECNPSRMEFMDGLAVSYEASASTFAINVLEPFVLFPLQIYNQSVECRKDNMIRTCLMTQSDAKKRHMIIAMKP